MRRLWSKIRLSIEVLVEERRCLTDVKCMDGMAMCFMRFMMVARSIGSSLFADLHRCGDEEAEGEHE